MEKLQDYFKAGFSHFVIRTEEPEKAIEWIMSNVEEWREGFPVKVWGFSNSEPDPMAPLLEAEQGEMCLILKNYHWFMTNSQTGEVNYETVQFILDRLTTYRSPDRRVLFFIVCNKALDSAVFPDEIKREFVEIPHSLPTRQEIVEILDKTIEIASRNPKFQPVENKDALVEAARGMTRFEAQNSFFLSLVKTASLDAGEVIRMRTRFLEGVAGVKYVKPNVSFEGLRGLGRLKTFTLKTIHNVLSKGVILVGPPGTGKTHFISALSAETGYPCFMVEMAEWQGGIVGETEAKVRKAIEAFLALAPKKTVESRSS